MRDSMHILDQLRQRGYEPREHRRGGEPFEEWFDRHFDRARLRVILSDDGLRLCAFDAHMALEWDARFCDGTPSSVILAALSAAEHDAGGEDAQLIGHWHSYAGQTLEHSHVDGDEPHGYYGHPEDAGSR